MSISDFFAIVGGAVALYLGWRWSRRHLDDNYPLPLSYWSEEQLNMAFARSPIDRVHHERLGTLSRNQWRNLLARRDREVVAELKRRGFTQKQLDEDLARREVKSTVNLNKDQ